MIDFNEITQWIFPFAQNKLRVRINRNDTNFIVGPGASLQLDNIALGQQGPVILSIGKIKEEVNDDDGLITCAQVDIGIKDSFYFSGLTTDDATPVTYDFGALTFRGDYDSGTTYSFGETVAFNGLWWDCIADSPISNVTPGVNYHVPDRWRKNYGTVLNTIFHDDSPGALYSIWIERLKNDGETYEIIFSGDINPNTIPVSHSTISHPSTLVEQQYQKYSLNADAGATRMRTKKLRPMVDILHTYPDGPLAGLPEPQKFTVDDMGDWAPFYAGIIPEDIFGTPSKPFPEFGRDIYGGDDATPSAYFDHYLYGSAADRGYWDFAAFGKFDGGNPYPGVLFSQSRFPESTWAISISLLLSKFYAYCGFETEVNLATPFSFARAVWDTDNRCLVPFEISTEEASIAEQLFICYNYIFGVSPQARFNNADYPIAAWDSGTTYAKAHVGLDPHDEVSYNGQAWSSNQDDNTGNAPGTTDVNNVPWWIVNEDTGSQFTSPTAFPWDQSVVDVIQAIAIFFGCYVRCEINQTTGKIQVFIESRTKTNGTLPSNFRLLDGSSEQPRRLDKDFVSVGNVGSDLTMRCPPRLYGDAQDIKIHWRTRRWGENVPHPRVNWDSGVTYNKGDEVFKDGVDYVAVQDGLLDAPPPFIGFWEEGVNGKVYPLKGIMFNDGTDPNWEQQGNFVRRHDAANANRLAAMGWVLGSHMFWFNDNAAWSVATGYPPDADGIETTDIQEPTGGWIGYYALYGITEKPGFYGVSPGFITDRLNANYAHAQLYHNELIGKKSMLVREYDGIADDSDNWFGVKLGMEMSTHLRGKDRTFKAISIERDPTYKITRVEWIEKIDSVISETGVRLLNGNTSVGSVSGGGGSSSLGSNNNSTTVTSPWIKGSTSVPVVSPVVGSGSKQLSVGENAVVSGAGQNVLSIQVSQVEGHNAVSLLTGLGTSEAYLLPGESDPYEVGAHGGDTGDDPSANGESFSAGLGSAAGKHGAIGINGRAGDGSLALVNGTTGEHTDSTAIGTDTYVLHDNAHNYQSPNTDIHAAAVAFHSPDGSITSNGVGGSLLLTDTSEVDGQHSHVLGGNDNSARGFHTFILNGQGIIANNYGGLTIGQWNAPAPGDGTEVSFNIEGLVFQIGNGDNIETRHNALSFYNNGLLYIQDTQITTDDGTALILPSAIQPGTDGQFLGTVGTDTQWVDAPSGGGGGVTSGITVYNPTLTSCTNTTTATEVVRQVIPGGDWLDGEIIRLDGFVKIAKGVNSNKFALALSIGGVSFTFFDIGDNVAPATSEVELKVQAVFARIGADVRAWFNPNFSGNNEHFNADGTSTWYGESSLNDTGSAFDSAATFAAVDFASDVVFSLTAQWNSAQADAYYTPEAWKLVKIGEGSSIGDTTTKFYDTTEVTAPYSISVSDNPQIFITDDSADFDVTLPAAADVPMGTRFYIVDKHGMRGDGSFTHTLKTTGGDTLSGSSWLDVSSVPLTGAFASMEVMSDHISEWLIVGHAVN